MQRIAPQKKCVENSGVPAVNRLRALNTHPDTVNAPDSRKASRFVALAYQEHRRELDRYLTDGTLTALVTSANPHDGSSAHSNVAVRFNGPLAQYLIDSEMAVALCRHELRPSRRGDPAWSSSSYTPAPGPHTVPAPRAPSPRCRFSGAYSPILCPQGANLLLICPARYRAEHGSPGCGVLLGVPTGFRHKRGGLLRRPRGRPRWGGRGTWRQRCRR